MDRISISFLSVILFIICGITGTPLEESFQNRLVGSHTVYNRGDVPYQASLRVGDLHKCAGIIYKSRYVISTASCVYSLKASDLEVCAGMLALSTIGSKTQNIKAEEIFVHEDYNGPKGPNDVAVIKLEKDFIFNNYVNKIEIWNETLATSNGTKPSTLNCTVYGWGLDYFIDGPIWSRRSPLVDDLRAAEVFIIDKYCEMAYESQFASPQMVCAVGVGSSQSLTACPGDAGGPLVCSNYLFGIVSWESNCKKQNLPGVYTNALYYRDWIDAHSNNAQAGFPSFVTTLLLFTASLYINNVQLEP